MVRIVIYLTSMTCTSTDKDGSMSCDSCTGDCTAIQMLVLQTLVMEGDLLLFGLGPSLYLADGELQPHLN